AADETADQTEAADSDEDTTGDSTADVAATVDDVSGDWSVDTSIGEFSFENSTGTYVGFRIGEELASVGETEAVGRTPAVTGTVTIDGQTVTATTIEADMTAITTDIGQRDGAARRALDTTNFATATFVLTEPIDLGADPASGEPVSATAVGDLMIHGVTNPVEVAIDAQLVGNTIAIVGSTDVVFADYGVNVPSAAAVISLDDFGIIEFQLFLTQS
ncbi:MAG: YceI family protein, partial [Acidimicrobiia bacterium]|nr:YceI family protein [Acidimicrobiia bacterium]